MPRKSKRRTRRKRGGQIMSQQDKQGLIERLNNDSLSDEDKTNLYCSSPANAKLNKAIEGQIIDDVLMKNSPMRAATGEAQTLDGRERQCNEAFAWDNIQDMEDYYQEEGITSPQAKYADMIEMFDAPEGGRRRRRRRKSRKKRRKSKRKKSRRKRKRSRRRRRRR